MIQETSSQKRRAWINKPGLPNGAGAAGAGGVQGSTVLPLQACLGLSALRPGAGGGGTLQAQGPNSTGAAH